MKEDEDITTHFLRVDEIVNSNKVLGEEVKELVIVQKVLISLPMKFDPNIYSLEERAYISTLSMEDLHGILTTYEMRT